jgi:hypothetical protein
MSSCQELDERIVMRYRFAILMLIAWMLAGCSLPGASGLVVVPAFTEAVIGPNRLAFGLVRNNSPINDPGAQVQVRLFDLADPSMQTSIITDAVYYGQGLPVAVYVAYVDLDRAGEWGVEVSVKLSAEPEPIVSRLRLQVLERSSTPMIGQPAIAVKTLTLADVPNRLMISSAKVENEELYRISLDEALRSGRPIALLFATPGYCRSAVCAPNLKIFSDLQRVYGARMHFIHVEVYTYPFSEAFQKQSEMIAQVQLTGQQPTFEELHVGHSAPMAAWNLQSEPWLFLINAEGIITNRYEGGITRAEIEPAIQRVIGDNR